MQDFSVEKFLEIFPDPETYFQDNTRKPTIKSYNGYSKMYAVEFLKNFYPKIAVQTINDAYFKYSNLTKVCNKLDYFMKTGIGLLKTKRKYKPCNVLIENIPLLQEVLFYFDIHISNHMGLFF